MVKESAHFAQSPVPRIAKDPGSIYGPRTPVLSTQSLSSDFLNYHK